MGNLKKIFVSKRVWIAVALTVAAVASALGHQIEPEKAIMVVNAIWGVVIVSLGVTEPGKSIGDSH